MSEEYNDNLQFDAFTGGIEDGGLRSTQAISIMSCYIVAHSDEKITAQNIIDAMVIGKIANYFEISSAIAKQIKVGNLYEDEEGFLQITDKCRASVGIVETDLPITIREKSVELVRKLAKREIYKKENKVEIEKQNDKYKVTMHVSDSENDFMILSLIVPTEVQAEVIMEKFQEHPDKVYESLINGIFE